MILEERERIERIKKVSQKKIWVTFQREGIHCFPAAGTDPKLADVAFLAHPHRHMFHFRISIDVYHDDRELEFIQFKRWCESLYSGVLELNYKSCEMIADDLYDQIASKYPNRDVTLSIIILVHINLSLYRRNYRGKSKLGQ